MYFIDRKFCSYPGVVIGLGLRFALEIIITMPVKIEVNIGMVVSFMIKAAVLMAGAALMGLWLRHKEVPNLNNTAVCRRYSAEGAVKSPLAPPKILVNRI
jgi:hypothetical protein